MSFRLILFVFLIGAVCGYQVYHPCSEKHPWAQCGPFAFCVYHERPWEVSYHTCDDVCWERLPRLRADWNGGTHTLLVPRTNFTPIPHYQDYGVCVNGVPVQHDHAYWRTSLNHRTVARRTIVEYDAPGFTHLEAESFPELTDKPPHLKEQIYTNDCVRRVNVHFISRDNPPVSWYEPVYDGHSCGGDDGECFAWRCWKRTSTPLYCAPDINLPDGVRSGIGTPPTCSGQPPSAARWE